MPRVWDMLYLKNIQGNILDFEYEINHGDIQHFERSRWLPVHRASGAFYSVAA